MYTKEALINRAKAASDGIIGTNLPMLTEFYGDFIDTIGLDHDAFYHIKKYINKIDYDAKRHLFESIGFKVLYMTLSAMKVSRFASDEATGVSINQQFLDGKRNVFILDIEQGMDNLYFILEYSDQSDPLCNHTVDWDEVAKEKERSAAAKKWMDSVRAKRSQKTDSDNLF